MRRQAVTVSRVILGLPASASILMSAELECRKSTLQEAPHPAHLVGYSLRVSPHPFRPLSLAHHFLRAVNCRTLTSYAASGLVLALCCPFGQRGWGHHRRQRVGRRYLTLLSGIAAHSSRMQASATCRGFGLHWRCSLLLHRRTSTESCCATKTTLWKARTVQIKRINARARARTHTHARRSLRCGTLAHGVDQLRRDTRVKRRSVTTTAQPFQCHILATAAFAHCAQFEVTRAGRTLCGRSASPRSRPQTLLVSGRAASYRARMCAWRSTIVAQEP